MGFDYIMVLTSIVIGQSTTAGRLRGLKLVKEQALEKPSGVTPWACSSSRLTSVLMDLFVHLAGESWLIIALLKRRRARLKRKEIDPGYVS